MRARVVRISCGSRRGTGVVVAPGRVATAFHVVDPSEGAPIVLRFARLVPADRSWQTAEVPARRIEGAQDADADWVLLSFDPAALGWSPEPAKLRALDESEVDGTRLAWRSYGFPDAQPDDGTSATGHVQTTRAEQGGQVSLSLFSHEAAAGQGMPVAGFSGAPVFVDGAVVGLLRWALTDQERGAYALPRSEGGTLLAVPVGALHDPSMPLPVGGLPPLPPLRTAVGFPELPFPGLARYTAAHARVFFGRRRDVRRLLGLLAEGTPVVLLFGASGVGKSSLLHAGVAPRVAGRVGVVARGAEGLAGSWRTLLEDDLKLRVLDQVEEAWTRGAGRSELDGLCRGIASEVDGGVQVVLSFRKEWLPEVEAALRAHGLAYTRCFVEPLDRAGLLAAVRGLVDDREVAQAYGLSIEDGVADAIVETLSTEVRDGIGPVLQVALRRLWERAVDHGAPLRFRMSDWEADKAQGLGLPELVRSRLTALEGGEPLVARAAASGLALELLAAFVTGAGTAGRLSKEELGALFSATPAPALAAVVVALSEGWLLTADGVEAWRLSHDSLAPVVLSARAEASGPAQQARRVLSARLPLWERGGPVLDRGELEVVEGALADMPALAGGALSLLEDSRAHHAVGRQVGRQLGRSMASTLAGLVGLLFVALVLERIPALHVAAVRRTVEDTSALQGPPGTTTMLLQTLPVVAAWERVGIRNPTVWVWAERAYRLGRLGRDLPPAKVGSNEPHWSDENSLLARVVIAGAWLDGREEGGHGLPELHAVPDAEALDKLTVASRAELAARLLRDGAEDDELARVLESGTHGAWGLAPLLQARRSASVFAGRWPLDSFDARRAAPHIGLVDAVDLTRRDEIAGTYAEDPASYGFDQVPPRLAARPPDPDALQRLTHWAEVFQELHPCTAAELHLLAAVHTTQAEDVDRTLAVMARCTVDPSPLQLSNQDTAWAPYWAAFARLAARTETVPTASPSLQHLFVLPPDGSLPRSPEGDVLPLVFSLHGLQPGWLQELQPDAEAITTADVPAHTVVSRSLAMAAFRASRMGPDSHHPELVTAWADACGPPPLAEPPDHEFSCHPDELAVHLHRAGHTDRALTLLESRPKGATDCTTWLEVGGVDAAHRCAQDGHYYGTPQETAALSHQLHLAGHNPARLLRAALGLGWDERSPLHLDGFPAPLPLSAALLRSTDDPEICTEVTFTAVAYAHIGDLRRAHLVSLLCRDRWMRALSALHISAAAEGHPMWAPQHLHAWVAPLLVDPLDTDEARLHDWMAADPSQ